MGGNIFFLFSNTFIFFKAYFLTLKKKMKNLPLCLHNPLSQDKHPHTPTKQMKQGVVPLPDTSGDYDTLPVLFTKTNAHIYLHCLHTYQVNKHK